MNNVIIFLFVILNFLFFLSSSIFGLDCKIISNEASYETHNKLLQEVEKNWKINSIKTKQDSNCALKNHLNNNSDLLKKLTTIIISRIDLEDATINEAIDYLKQKIVEADPEKKGINIILQLPSEQVNESLNISNTYPHIFLQLRNVPILTALDYLARQTNLTLHIDLYAVSLLAPEINQHFTVKEYDVPIGFFAKKSLSNSSDFLSAEKFFYPAKEYLQNLGVEFPEGSGASYLPLSSKLIVKNSQENIDLIDAIIKASIEDAPYQLSIETKFIEVTEDTLNQLGFNWLMGPLELGSSGLELSGENNNTQHTRIGDNSIDFIMNQNSHNAIAHTSPNILSVAGIYTSSQFQVVLRALQQKKGIDLMAAPHITTKNGIKAIIKIIDEFIYPAQYTPPQLPQSTTNSSSHNAIHETPPTIAPAFPNSWTKKNLGVTLEAKPTINLNGSSITLELHPQITDFDGFINYGTPINTIGYSFATTNVSMVPFASTLTTNTINQPVFTIREINTSVVIGDGQTLVLGGLIREDIQKMDEKVPILGDIPLAGQLFRSKIDRKLKKNLIIFVTPRILNLNGQPIHR